MSKFSSIDGTTRSDLGNGGHAGKTSYFRVGAEDAAQGRNFAPPSAPFDVEDYIIGYFDVVLKR